MKKGLDISRATTNFGQYIFLQRRTEFTVLPKKPLNTSPRGMNKELKTTWQQTLDKDAFVMTTKKLQCLNL